MAHPIFLFSAGIALVSGVAYVLVHETPPIDEATYCAVSEPPRRHAVVLVDATDPRTPEHIQALSESLAVERGKLQKGDRITLLKMTDALEPETLFDKCNPGGGDECGLDEPCTLRNAQFQNGYKGAVGGILRDLAVATSTPQSPLLQNFRWIGMEGRYFNASEENRLIVLTDAAHYEKYSGKLNFIRNAPNFSAIKDAYPKLVDARFAKVSVEALLIERRYGKLIVPGDAHRTFLKEYFTHAGASDVTIRWAVPKMLTSRVGS